MFSFGDDRVDFNNVVHRGHLTLRHLLLEGWDASWETLPYPPAQGDFAVYDIDELKEKINFAVTNVRLRNNIWHNSSFVRSFLPSLFLLKGLLTFTEDILFLVCINETVVFVCVFLMHIMILSVN